MKRTNQILQIVILAAILFLTSCQTPEFLLKRGQYDASVVEAIERLQKKRKKKRKDVEVVEEAFRKVTKADMDKIASLKAEGRPSNWVKINKIHNYIKERQELIAPHLPLVAKDGYKAEFRFVKINALERESRENAAEYYYASGKELLEKGERGSKYAAREAWTKFDKTRKYFDNYKDAMTLRDRALVIGKNHILVQTTNESRVVMPRDFEEELLSINIAEFSSKWTRYYTDTKLREDFDFEFTMKLRDIEVSPELVQERRYVDQKEIEDGFNYVLDNNGNVLKDTLGNDIKTPRYINIQAWVDEVHQKKTASLHSRLVLKDLATGEIIRNENMNVTAIFENYAATFQGDRRALSRDSKRRIGNSPRPFPSDEALIFDALDKIKPALRNKIEDCAAMASL